MPGSSTTPGHPGTRAYAPVRIAFHLRNGVGTRDMNLCGAQWLAYALPCRRFAAALTDLHARLRVDVGRYSFIVSDLHRLLVAGLPTHCERFWTSGSITANFIALVMRLPWCQKLNIDPLLSVILHRVWRLGRLGLDGSE